MNSDSVKAIIKKQAFGAFAQAAAGTNKLITLENDVLKMNLSSKGGRVASVELKNYKTFDGKPLTLFYPDSSAQNLSFTANSLKINTDSLYFTNERIYCCW